MAITQKLKDVHYKAALQFAQLIDTTPLTKEEWAKRDTEDWAKRMERLADEEANEEMVDVFTGKKLGKRKDIRAF